MRLLKRSEWRRNVEKYCWCVNVDVSFRTPRANILLKIFEDELTKMLLCVNEDVRFRTPIADIYIIKVSSADGMYTAINQPTHSSAATNANAA